MSETLDHPAHLDPSELGTKEYWDNYYQNDLDQDDEDNEGGQSIDPADLESWFDDVNAPSKILEYLTSETFPLSPYNLDREIQRPRVLDLGTGNGGMLFRLRMEGGYSGVMTGLDYSQQSIDLAKKLYEQYLQEAEDGNEDRIAIDHATMRFENVDLIRDDPRRAPWWPRHGRGYDLVLDKGTFDAISLSSETVEDETGKLRRICELYPKKVAEMVEVGGYLLITSCNWTEDEVLKWFLHNEDVKGKLELFGKINYPVFQFGGNQGSGVVSLCFKRISTAS